ncbi:MAG: hemerythrin domain-containing protein [Bacteroidetes bacterium]|nr:hemerythrin domain-containing protein [Bacteroidota bacterium]
METTKPLKRSPSIIAFSRDHHFALLAVWKIRTGLKKQISPERISKYALHYFENELQSHFKEEELFLFSKLPANDALRIEAESDHLHIKKIMDSLAHHAADISALTNLADLLEKHIRFEERNLFNHIQKQITEAELSSIASQIKERGHEAENAWEDAFWKETNEPKIYATVLEALTDLNKRGYTYDFNLQQDCVYCHDKKISLRPNEFHIVETHRFEAMSDPSENAVIYVIESPVHEIKGVLLNAYGVYSDSISSELIAKLK